MVDLLIQYAHKHGLVLEPGFKPKTVKWAIVLNDQGVYLDVIPLGDTSLGIKNPGKIFPICPHLEQPELITAGKGSRHFLIDSCKVVALLKADLSDDKVNAQHQYFINLLKQASNAMPELIQVVQVLSDCTILNKIQERLTQLSAKETDNVTFKLGEHYPVETDRWHDWWRKFREQLNAKRGGETSQIGSKKPSASHDQLICFATGQEVIPEKTHPKIFVSDVGGQASGSVLIGFDKDAFESYGLTQSSNAAMSSHAAKAYADALNNMLQKHSQRLVGAKVIHWFSHSVPEEDDPLAWLEAAGIEQQEWAAQKQAENLLRQIHTGQRADLANNFYYAMTVSGSGGRVMVRDWMMGRFEDLVDSVEHWFSNLSIVRYDGDGLAKENGIQRVITCLLPPKAISQKESDWIKPIGSARLQLWKAALNKHHPIPYSVMARIVNLHLPFMLNGYDAEQPDLLQRRMSLLKAYHNRKSQGGQHMNPYLNENHPEPAYHCGRLMAVLAQLQYAALKDVGAGVIQRYYAAASVTPALVLGRLIRNHQFHLNKLESGLAYWFEDKIASIWSRIHDRVPKVLSLEEQSLFALGYYQQIAADRANKNKTQQQEESNNG